MPLTAFLSELRRRRVFRVAAWYGAVAWLVIQLVNNTFPAFDIPAWATRFVILLLLAGFPVAIVLAWVFDLTPTGIERTAPASPAGKSSGLLSGTLALAAGVLLGFGAFTGWRALDAPATSDRPGIAVLAFDVLGVEANRALAGGLHEAVLDELAHINGLRVIARSSVLRFAETKPDLREVGRILDVPYLLEGSVQREGGRLRVHAQLIDAVNNQHLWSETYDRADDDLFGMQTALARDIATRLRITLQPEETARAARPPTRVPAAYDAYLRGATEFTRYQLMLDGQNIAPLRATMAAFDEALRLDPGFALAHAERARALMTYYWLWRHEFPDAEHARDDALVAATEALRLDPQLGEAHRALGVYFYYGHLDYPRADLELTRASQLLPNDSTTLWLLGLLRRRQNRFDETLELFRKGYALDPGNAALRTTYMYSLFGSQRYAESERAVADLLARFPNDGNGITVRGLIGFCQTGDSRQLLAVAETGTGNARWDAFQRWRVAMFDGRFAEALPIVQAASGERFGVEDRLIALAMTQRFAGDRAAAALTLAPLIAESEQQIAADPTAFNVGVSLGLAYALAGRPDEARRAIRAYLENSPLARSALEHWEARYEAARVYAQIGDIDQAFAELQAYQDGPEGECGNFIRRLPEFAPLRADPRLEALAKKSDWPKEAR